MLLFWLDYNIDLKYYFWLFSIELTQRQFPRPFRHWDSIPRPIFEWVTIFGKLLLKIDSMPPYMENVCHPGTTA